MRLSKIDVAEAQICAAVRMFFKGGHLVPIYTLANAAREIVSSIGEQIGISRFITGPCAICTRLRPALSMGIADT
jgi:hypothetical protein